MDLSITAIIWNRAAVNEECEQLARGDCALSALLRLHGLIMNGGVINAVEVMEQDEFNNAVASYQFFGLDAVSKLLMQVKKLLSKDAEIEPVEALMDSEYQKIIPDDSFLFSLFEKYYFAHPDDFSKLHMDDTNG